MLKTEEAKMKARERVMAQKAKGKRKVKNVMM